MERIAVISDIHGNMPALEVVLDDIRSRGIDRILCLGDVVGKGPHPERAVDIIRDVCDVVLLGNWDDTAACGQDFTDLPSLGWHRQKLGDERLKYLANLPPVYDVTFCGKNVRLYHASHIGIYHRIHRNAPDEEHRAMFTNTGFTGNNFRPDIVGYGDIHSYFQKDLDGRMLFNAGSVGNPLDNTLATYVILEGSEGIISVRVVRLPYDYELSIRQAADAGMPHQEEWEDELRTGIYRLNPASKTWRKNN